jgi:hypothetical protein
MCRGHALAAVTTAHAGVLALLALRVAMLGLR